MTKLPDFVTFFNLPKEYTIINDSDGFGIEEDSSLKFKTIAEVYYHINDTIEGNPLFHKDLVPTEGDELYEGFYSIRSEAASDGSTQVLLAYSHKDRLKALKSDYKEFLAIAKEFKKNPKDFYTAYMFLQLHPMTWSRKAERANNWTTQDGLQHMWTTVFKPTKDKYKKKVRILLEHGPFMDIVDKEGNNITHSTSSHDIRLDTVANTYEKAIISLAKKVAKYYDETGSDKN